VIRFYELLLFPFWCLDAKGGEEFIYLSLYHLLLYLVLGCKTLNMSVVWTWILNHSWCACKNLFSLLWLV
jgi:hypothetical protein